MNGYDADGAPLTYLTWGAEQEAYEEKVAAAMGCDVCGRTSPYGHARCEGEA